MKDDDFTYKAYSKYAHVKDAQETISRIAKAKVEDLLKGNAMLTFGMHLKSTHFRDTYETEVKIAKVEVFYLKERVLYR